MPITLHLASHPRRSGSVYIAVLGTSLIVSLLAISALALQRLQNRMLTDTADVRQAQLNAETALELGRLILVEEADWRTTYADSAAWFADRPLDRGRCSLEVSDPDGVLDDDPRDPLVMTGIGTAGIAERRVQMTIDPRDEPLGCLRAALASGGFVGFSNSVLRTQRDSLLSAATMSASSSVVEGTVEAGAYSGGSYVGSASTADQLPEMPDWDTVFDYYRDHGTEIRYNDLPSTPPNLGRNAGIGGGTSYWTPTGSSDIAQTDNYAHSGQHSLRVDDRDDYEDGAAQRIDHAIKPNTSYHVEVWVRHDDHGNLLGNPRFEFTWITKRWGEEEIDTATAGRTQIPNSSSESNGWTRLSANFSSGNWNDDLEYAYLRIASIDQSFFGSPMGTRDDFYLDDLVIRENISGRCIYREVLSPERNPFGDGATNPAGIYWIDCGGNKLTIERSRIHGTLLVINPGSSSNIAAGPIHWSPAVPGYPALLVDADNATSADFTIGATGRPLSEADNGVNFNPPGASHEAFDPQNGGVDNAQDDVYPAEIRGLIAIEDDLTLENRPRVRGQILVGGDLNLSGSALHLDYQPEALLSPPPGFRAAPSHHVRPDSPRRVVWEEEDQP